MALHAADRLAAADCLRALSAALTHFDNLDSPAAEVAAAHLSMVARQFAQAYDIRWVESSNEP